MSASIIETVVITDTSLTIPSSTPILVDSSTVSTITSNINQYTTLDGSAMQLLGRRWHFGADDLAVPACGRV